MIDSITLEAYLSARHSSRMLNQPDDCSASNRLSGAGFADHAEDLALRDIERHVVDGDELAPAAEELNSQISNAKRGLSHLSLGFRASRSQSPSRLMDSDRMMREIDGNSRIHHSPENRNC